MQGSDASDSQHGHTQFLGAAGQVYVAHCLTRRGLHAALTLGNAPDVDIIVAEPTGAAALSLQVKTATNACKQHFGREAGEWRISRSAYSQGQKELWYALVDMPSEDRDPPKVFLVPSLWIAGFLALQMTDEDIRSRYPKLCTRRDAFYYLVRQLWPDCEERWDRVRSFLEKQPDTLDWCQNCPQVGRDWKDQHRWVRCAQQVA